MSLQRVQGPEGPEPCQGLLMFSLQPSAKEHQHRSGSSEGSEPGSVWCSISSVYVGAARSNTPGKAPLCVYFFYLYFHEASIVFQSWMVNGLKLTPSHTFSHLEDPPPIRRDLAPHSMMGIREGRSQLLKERLRCELGLWSLVLHNCCHGYKLTQSARTGSHDIFLLICAVKSFSRNLYRFIWSINVCDPTSWLLVPGHPSFTFIKGTHFSLFFNDEIKTSKHLSPSTLKKTT